MANYKPGMNPNSFATRIKPGLKNVAKLRKLTPGGLALTGLGSLGASIGTVSLSTMLNLAGGMMSLTAAGIGVANTVVKIGLSSARAAGGVVNAAGGIAGGGKSGNVKKEKQRQMVQSVLNKKGPTGKSGSGTGIANVQSTLADFDIPEGSMSMLPTGDEDGMGMLSGMLHQIAVNTSYLGGIDSKIDALVGLSSISVIDQAQEDRGDGPPGEKPDGILKRSFNSLRDGLATMSNGLGSAGRNIIKGLGLVAGFIAFKKFEPQITSALASLFENVSGFFDTMSGGADPSQGILGYFDAVMESSILPALEIMAAKAIDLIFRAVKFAINEVTGREIFDLSRPVSAENPIDASLIKENQSSVTRQSFDQVVQTMGGMENMGTIRSFGTPGIEPQYYGLKGSQDQQFTIEAALKERLNYMYQIFDKTGGRVQWTNIGDGFSKLLGADVGSLVGKYSVKDIMTSQPIVDGVVRNESDLSKPDLLPTPNLTGESLQMYLENLRKNTTLQQEMLEKGTMPGQGKAIKKLQLKFDTNLKENLLLLEGTPSSSSGQGEITAAIDASHNSQHMHETTIAGLTNVYHSDLNMPAFMNNNQVA